MLDSFEAFSQSMHSYHSHNRLASGYIVIRKAKAIHMWSLEVRRKMRKKLIDQHSNHFESPSKHLHLHPRQSKTSLCVKLSN